MGAWESAAGSAPSCVRLATGATLLLRADAGPSIGVGHLMRCLALAETWIHAGGSALAVSTGLPPRARDRLAAAGVHHTEIEASPGSPADAEGTIQCAARAGAAWLLIDGYPFDVTYQRALKAAGHRLLAVDDFGHMGEYAADLVLDQNLGARPEAYARRAPSTRLLLGSRFVLLRRQFSGRPRGPVSSRSAPCRVLVTLGGGDSENVAAKVVRAVERVSAAGVAEAIVVLGDSYAHTLTAAGGEAGPRVQFRRSVGDMAALMAECDLAIAGGGTTAWELAVMGVPTLHLALADNQVSNCEQLAAVGAGRYLGWHADLTADQIADALFRCAADPGGRAEMSRRGQALVDGWGCWRVWLYLNEDRLRLRDAGPKDMRRLWDWSNAPEVREISFSPDPIPWEAHVAWFEARRRNPGCRTWVGEEPDDGPVGQVRFDLLPDQAVISMSLDAAARGRQMGSLLIWTACRRLFAERPEVTVLALIKPENVASIRAFVKAGFTPAGERTVAGRPALAFTLRREQVAP